MTGTDELYRSELERRYLEPEPDPDWDDVLARAAEHAPARRPRRPLALALVATLALAAGVLVLLQPWAGAPTFVQQALAAVGHGRYITAELLPRTSASSSVDLATGKTSIVVPRIQLVYDTRSGAYSAHSIVGKVVMDGDPTPDPLVSGFASGYRAALERGDAREVGRATVSGVAVRVIRFTTSTAGVAGREDVAVDASTHEPLRVTYSTRDAHGRQIGQATVMDVVGIGSSDTRPRRTGSTIDLYRWPRLTGNASDVRDVRVSQAKAALGHDVLWPGPAVAGATLERLRLQWVTTIVVAGFRTRSHALGLRFDYRAGRDTLSVEETTSAQRGYEFWSPTFGLTGPILPPGQATFACYGCARPRPDPVWLAQLHQDGLFVTIRSPNRRLTLSAVRALRQLS
jgi:hypothetical protein